MKTSKTMKQLLLLKPATLFCYLCGREFGTKSFSIHLKNCQTKYLTQKQSILKEKSSIKQLIVLPQSPQLLQTILEGNYEQQVQKKYNEQAYKIYKYKILPKCKSCGRTFNKQSLLVHQKGCDKKSSTSIGTQINTSIKSIYQKQYKKPQTLLCCVCGRQFGTKSLKIHYPQCLQKFNNDQFMRHKNPKDRRTPPQFSQSQLIAVNTKEVWTDQQIQLFHKDVMIKYRNQSMIQCINCKRKFIPESIQKHQKNCVLINGNLNPDALLKRSQSQKVMHFYQKNIKKPKCLMCYICGRDYGLTSLIIHQKACYQKFKLLQQNKPKQQRKKIPKLPQQIQKFDIQNALNWTEEQIDSYNEIVNQTYNKKTLAECYICQRTFFQDSLAKHIVHCQNNLQKLRLKRDRSQQQSKKLIRCQSIRKQRLDQSLSKQKQIQKPRILMCYICGRQFGLSSLSIHLKVCPQKYLNQQNQKPLEQQKSIPQLPLQLVNQEYDIRIAIKWSNEKIQLYNKIVNQVYNQKSLQQCYICERTFIQEAFVKHIKHCQAYFLEKVRKNKLITVKEKEIYKKYQDIQENKKIKQAQNLQKITKPKMLTCHICGRQFGLTSLTIHQSKCIQKFSNLQNLKPKIDRKKPPTIQNQFDLKEYDITKAEQWTRQKIDIYNEICNKVYKHKSLTKCQYCKRSFFDEQIQKHKKFCQKQTIKNLQKQKTLNEYQINILKKCKSMDENQFINDNQKLNGKIRQPKTLSCHVCGRQFGLTSLKIHLPRCEQKFIKQQQLKPQQKRKKLPQLFFIDKQYNIDEAQNWTSQQIKLYNQKSTEIYRKQSLQICQFCCRSFFTEQLPKHQKFCEKQHERKLKKMKSQGLIMIDQKSGNQINYSQSPSHKNYQQSPSHKNVVMPVITQQIGQSSISPEASKKLFFQDPNSKVKNNVFKLFSMQISDFNDQPDQSDKLNKILTENQNKINQQQQQKQQKPISNLKIDVKLQDIDDFFVKKVIQKINCQHCNRKVKSDLYQRHMQMCRSNASMTGYINKKKIPVQNQNSLKI